MRTVALSNGTSVNIAELSIKSAMAAIKEDFRNFPFMEAWKRNDEDIKYICKYLSASRVRRALVETSKFARMYNV